MPAATATTSPPDGAGRALPAARPSGTAGRSGAAWMPEVQGLRTIALLLVATYHVWFNRVSGGVDVFLFVSAYLMTRSLMGRLERGEPVRPLGYVVRKFARLMPLAVVVAALVLVAAVAILPRSHATGYIEQFWASSAYFENLWLQNDLTNYFATDAAAKSPFQHYWSLSVQGQVFLLWPLLFGLLALVRRIRPVSPRPLAIGVFGAIFALGLVWACLLTAQDQQYAYFDLSARLWEFAAGSLVALCHPWIALRRRTREIASWIGLVGIATCGFVVPVEGTFPGVAALWPLASAALIILSAGERTRFGADRVFANPVLAKVGGYTYALYLVHWPVLILALALLGRETADATTGALVLLASAVLSFVLVHAVERPATRLTKPRRPSALGWRPLVAVVALPALAFSLVGPAGDFVDARRADARTVLASADLSRLGPNAGPDELAIPAEDSLPGVWAADQDLSWIGGCPAELLPDDYSTSPYAFCQSNADRVDPATAERSILLVGSSHIQQATAMFDEAASRQGWSLRSYFVWGCQFDRSFLATEEDARQCGELWSSVTPVIERERPDLVVVMSTRAMSMTEEHEVEGLDAWISRLTALGVQVVALRDHPRSESDPLVCGERHGMDHDACAAETTLAGPTPDLDARIEAAGGIPLDLNADICPGSICRPTYGGLVVFKDNAHITATYSSALAWRTAPRLHDRLPWWPESLPPASLQDE